MYLCSKGKLAVATPMKIGIDDHSDDSETDEENMWLISCMTGVWTATICDEVDPCEDDPDAPGCGDGV